MDMSMLLQAVAGVLLLVVLSVLAVRRKKKSA